MKKLIVDIDNTICKTSEGEYENATIILPVVKKLIEYRNKGFEIILHTSRNMRTYNNNVGKINLEMIPVLVKWLKQNNIPCDELHVGKPWCGFEGFYIDDKSIRPSEFISMEYGEIIKKIKN